VVVDVAATIFLTPDVAHGDVGEDVAGDR
jgi:hypothetical protein